MIICSSPSFYLMPLSVLGSHSRYHITLNCCISLGSSWICHFSDFSCFWWPWHLWKIHFQVCYRMLFYCNMSDMSDVFLIIREVLWGFFLFSHLDLYWANVSHFDRDTLQEKIKSSVAHMWDEKMSFVPHVVG